MSARKIRLIPAKCGKDGEPRLRPLPECEDVKAVLVNPICGIKPYRWKNLVLLRWLGGSRWCFAGEVLTIVRKHCCRQHSSDCWLKFTEVTLQGSVIPIVLEIMNKLLKD